MIPVILKVMQKDNFHKLYRFLFVPGCDNLFDGLVCWPATATGKQARVECFHIKAFAQAFKQIKENFGLDAIGQSGEFCQCLHGLPDQTFNLTVG